MLTGDGAQGLMCDCQPWTFRLAWFVSFATLRCARHLPGNSDRSPVPESGGNCC